SSRWLPRRASRTRPRSGRSSANTAFVLLLLIGWIADSQSSGRHAERHVQDNLFWPVPAAVIGLDDKALSPHHGGVSRPDGRPGDGRKAAGEESPGSIDMRCRITSGGGDPRESATENEPPCFALRSFAGQG